MTAAPKIHEASNRCGSFLHKYLCVDCNATLDCNKDYTIFIFHKVEALCCVDFKKVQILLCLPEISSNVLLLKQSNNMVLALLNLFNR